MSKIIAVLVGLLIVGQALAASLIINPEGKLVGATEVSVAGILYDVNFYDGSCNSLFNGCDPTQIIFNSDQQAALASQALLDQVLIDSTEGQFNSSPWLINGITHDTLGFIFTFSYQYEPNELYPHTFNGATVQLRPDGVDGVLTGGVWPPDSDSKWDASRTNAVWSLTPVPIDSDNDGLYDIIELALKLNPNKIDSNNNGTLDGDEDADEDGLSNLEEQNIKTNPSVKDTDRDGLSDGYEVTEGLNPLDENDCPQYICQTGISGWRVILMQSTQ